MMVKTLTKRINRILAAVLTIAALAVGQNIWAETVTYTITGDTDGQGNVELKVTASGSANGMVSTTWSYASAQSISINLEGGITLSFGSDKTSSLSVKDWLAISADGNTGGYITLSHASKYIYHITLKNDKENNNIIHQAWNTEKSYTYRFQQTGVKYIEVEYATAIPFTDAVISGINSEYIVSNAPIAPTPILTWHGTTLTKDTHYTLSYQNNTAAGTATVKATGKGKFSSSTSVSKNYTLVWATYSVRFNKNNDNATGTMSDQSFYYTEEKALTANGFTRTGYTFDRWTTNADGTGDSYTDGQSVSNLTAENGTTIDLYAQWTAPYIDADGNEQTCSNYNIITGSTDNTVTLGTDGTESWYVVDDNVSITNNGSEALNFHGAVHLILMDGATLTVEGRLPILAYGSLTIYGQSYGTGSLVANGSSSAISVSDYNNLIANVGTLTINGGNITATSTGSNSISVSNAITINGGSVTASSSYMYGNGITSTNSGITINGGTVNATGGSQNYGIIAYGTLTLGWTAATDCITANRFYSYSPNGIVVKSGQAFTDGTNIYAVTLTDTQVSSIAGKTLQPVDALVLADNADNTSIINSHNGETVNVMLYGRTLYKDGAWNTLCLPFVLYIFRDIKDNESHPLYDATIMTFDKNKWYNADGVSSGSYTSGSHRSGQVEDGNLYLYFMRCMVGNNSFYTNYVYVGEPFLVKWDGDGTNNIVNPVFTGVTISNDDSAMNIITMEGYNNATQTGNVTFKSTYSPVTFNAEDKSVLFMGGNNTLYYPEAGARIGAFRAYFQLNGPIANVREFKLNFGEENEAAGITTTDCTDYSDKAGAWYDMQGRKVGKPTKAGLYIHNGSKVVIM